MNHDYFSRKVPAYFDGTLSESERTELEAYVGTHADFALYFKKKEAEYEALKLRIPRFAMSSDFQSQIDSELKDVITHLFHDERAQLTQKFTSWLKEKL